MCGRSVLRRGALRKCNRLPGRRVNDLRWLLCRHNEQRSELRHVWKSLPGRSGLQCEYLPGFDVIGLRNDGPFGLRWRMRRPGNGSRQLRDLCACVRRDRTVFRRRLPWRLCGERRSLLARRRVLQRRVRGHYRCLRNADAADVQRRPRGVHDRTGLLLAGLQRRPLRRIDLCHFRPAVYIRRRLLLEPLRGRSLRYRQNHGLSSIGRVVLVGRSIALLRSLRSRDQPLHVRDRGLHGNRGRLRFCSRLLWRPLRGRRQWRNGLLTRLLRRGFDLHRGFRLLHGRVQRGPLRPSRLSSDGQRVYDQRRLLRRNLHRRCLRYAMSSGRLRLYDER